MKLPKLSTGQSLLVTLSLILAASGAVRLGHGVGMAMALQAEPAQLDVAAPVQCPSPPERLLEALRVRTAQIEAQEEKLLDRKAALELSERAIETRLAELMAAEARLRETISIADGAAEKDVQRLTAVYEAMKPAEAAALFKAMAPEFAAGFLGRMRPEAAAAILGGMPSDTAYSVSVLIAGRNALAPKE